MSKLISIGEITTYKKGYAFKSKDYSSEGIPIVKVSDFDDHTVSTSSTKLKQEASDGFEDWKLQKNDVLIASVGSWATNPNSVVGKVVKVNGSLTDALLNQNCVRLRVKEGFDQEYLFYCLKNKNFSNHCIASAQGSANQASIKLDDIHAFMIPNFSLKEQQKISSLLSCQDKKIELNQKMNETLEEIAKTLFKSWFIDFDPVRAKVEGRPTGLSKEISDLFPDSFEESELGEIPKGWEVKEMQDLCISISSGGTPKRKEKEYWDNGTTKWFKTGELHDTYLLESEEKITEKAVKESSCKLWDEGTILFAIYASPTVGRLGILTEPSTSNQAAAGLIPKEYVGIPFLKNLLLFNRKAMQHIASGAAQQNINVGILKEFKVIRPIKELINYFSVVNKPIEEKIKSNLKEISCLRDLRDILLSKLISGELRIPDAEKLIEEADI